MRKKRKSFSLITKAVQKDMHESDIVITGYISKELFLLIEIMWIRKFEQLL